MGEAAGEEESDTIDRTVLQARTVTGEALGLLIQCLRDDKAMYADKLKAAQHILEVAGCLSL